MTNQCPLCKHDKIEDYHQDKKRSYVHCHQCDLVFVPNEFHLSAEDEKAEYDKHENAIDDDGYLRFLSRMAEPIHQRVNNHSKGIDIGCGEAPALAKLLETKGHTVALYDLFYHPNTKVLNEKYDFVTSTEVIEHIAQPDTFLEQLFSLVNDAGYLGLMTKLVIDKDRFANWHYKNDPTHICFYSKNTFKFILNMYRKKGLNAEIEFIGNDVIIFQITSNSDRTSCT